MTYSKDLRQRALAAVAQGMSPTIASQTFQVSRATLYRWMANPEPKPLPRTRSRKLDPQKLSTTYDDTPKLAYGTELRSLGFAQVPSAISSRN